MKSECISCGKPLTQNQIRQKGCYCSLKCSGTNPKAGLSNQDKQQNLDNFINRFNKIFKSRFEYIGGYSGSNEKFNCRCLKCGMIITTVSQCVRKGHETLKCLECSKEEHKQSTIIKKKLLIEDRENKHRINEQLKQQYETERIEQQIKERTAVCIQCGETFIGILKRMKYCSKLCARKMGDRVKESRKRNHLLDNGKIDWSITLDKLIKRDKGICHICKIRVNTDDYIRREDGTKITGNDYPSIDHVKAIANGGVHQWDNVRLAHRGCNSKKSDKDIYINSDGQCMWAM